MNEFKNLLLKDFFYKSSGVIVDSDRLIERNILPVTIFSTQIVLTWDLLLHNLQSSVAEPITAAERFRKKFRQFSRLGSDVPGTPSSVHSVDKDNEDFIESQKKITNYKDGEWISASEVGIVQRRI